VAVVYIALPFLGPESRFQGDSVCITSACTNPSNSATGLHKRALACVYGTDYGVQPRI